MSDHANESDRLPVPVTDYPYWRVVFRPKSYDPELIPSLTDCVKLVEKTRVRLRGWDFPFWSPHENEHSLRSTSIASWANFMGSIEYWELFQSGQFVHLAAVREATRANWREKLQEATMSHLGHWGHLKDFDWKAVPGYIDILNSVYTVTEIFEFAARVCQAGVYHGPLAITIELNGVKGYVLTTDFDRSWSEFRAASENHLGKTWEIASDDLISASAAHSMNAVAWLFERFGWLSPNLTPLNNDQQKFLSGSR